MPSIRWIMPRGQASDELEDAATIAQTSERGSKFARAAAGVRV
jgi:hypothetical protein